MCRDHDKNNFSQSYIVCVEKIRSIEVSIEMSKINFLLLILIKVGFFIPVSSLKVFGHSIHSERRRIYLGKSIQALQNDTIISYHGYSVSGSFSQQCGGIPLKLLCLCSSLFLFIIKTFRDSWLLKYLINKELMTFSNKIQAKTFTWPDMSFYAR